MAENQESIAKSNDILEIIENRLKNVFSLMVRVRNISQCWMTAEPKLSNERKLSTRIAIMVTCHL